MKSERKPEYFEDVLAGQGAGAQMDIRLKVAIQLLCSGHIPKEIMVEIRNGEGLEPLAYMQTAEAMAEAALNLSCELFAQAAKRNLVRELPENGHLPIESQRAIERNARAAYHQGMTQQKVHQEPGIAGQYKSKLEGR